MTTINKVLFPNVLWPSVGSPFLIDMRVYFMSSLNTLMFRPRYQIKFYASTRSLKDDTAVDITANKDIAYQLDVHRSHEGDGFHNVWVSN